LSLIVCIFAQSDVQTCAGTDNQNNQDCAACVATSGCGFCGVQGQGYCVPGDASGSQIGDGNYECPSDFWKYSTDQCDDPVRIVEVNETKDSDGNVIKIQWTSLSLNGLPEERKRQIDTSRVTFDLVAFWIQREDDNGTAQFGIGVGYASGLLSDTNLNVQLFAAVFDNFIEFVDSTGGPGLQIADIEADPEAYFYPLGNYSEFDYTVFQNGSQDIYTATAGSEDGKYSFVCQLSNTDFDYSNGDYTVTLSPYEMKCDLNVYEWVYRNHSVAVDGLTPTLAFQGYVASGSYTVGFQGGNASNTAIEFGEQVGFFEWAPNVTGSSSSTPDVYNDYDVVVTQIDLGTSPNLPPGTDVITTIFTVDNNGDNVNNMYWDPNIGVDPVNGLCSNNLCSQNGQSSDASVIVMTAWLFIAFFL